MVIRRTTTSSPRSIAASSVGQKTPYHGKSMQISAERIYPKFKSDGSLPGVSGLGEKDLKRKKTGGSGREAGRKEVESNRFLWEFLLTQMTLEIVVVYYRCIRRNHWHSLKWSSPTLLIITYVAVLLGAQTIALITILILADIPPSQCSLLLLCYKMVTVMSITILESSVLGTLFHSHTFFL
jgi:hypothetical protein